MNRYEIDMLSVACAIADKYVTQIRFDVFMQEAFGISQDDAQKLCRVLRRDPESGMQIDKLQRRSK